jgi:TDG/mug DNA glycosylase family protein
MSVLPDVLIPNLGIVFCGTAAGTASALRGAYYAGRGNAFWPTLYAVGLTPHLVKPENFKSITAFGLGLTDLAKAVFGADTKLKRGDFDVAGFTKKITHFSPRIVAFTSKRSAEVFLGQRTSYGLHASKIGGTRVFVLCSPSGAGRRHWNERVWRDLAQLHGGTEGKDRASVA